MAYQLGFNQSFLQDMMKVVESNDSMGELFSRYSPFFKMYSIYLNNYENAVVTSRELRQTVRHAGPVKVMQVKYLNHFVWIQNLLFEHTLSRAENDPRVGGLKLRDYLILPVQRIPRYKLLIRELLKHTPVDHSDFESLEKALDDISESAKSNNEHMKRQEQARDSTRRVENSLLL